MSDTIATWLFGGWSFKDSRGFAGIRGERGASWGRVRAAANSDSAAQQPATTVDERALVAALRRGDSGAFAQVFRQYYAQLVTFASTLLASPDRAEDVVQLVMWRLWERRASLDPARSIRSFLWVSVRNRIYDANRDDRRDNRRRMEAMDDPLLATHADVDELSSEDPWDHARAAIATLALADQEMLRLRLQELSLAEIGDLLGIRPQAAATRMTRAIARLRKAIFQESSPDL